MAFYVHLPYLHKMGVLSATPQCSKQKPFTTKILLEGWTEKDSTTTCDGCMRRIPNPGNKWGMELVLSCLGTEKQMRWPQKSSAIGKRVGSHAVKWTAVFFLNPTLPPPSPWQPSPPLETHPLWQLHVGQVVQPIEFPHLHKPQVRTPSGLTVCFFSASSWCNNDADPRGRHPRLLPFPAVIQASVHVSPVQSQEQETCRGLESPGDAWPSTFLFSPACASEPAGISMRSRFWALDWKRRPRETISQEAVKRQDPEGERRLNIFSGKET
jgi:hypothetical protein